MRIGLIAQRPRAEASESAAEPFGDIFQSLAVML